MTVPVKYILVTVILTFMEACGSCGRTPEENGSDVQVDFEIPETLVEGTAGLCGNGVGDEGETCDDGNRLDCDGCSRNCQVEENGCGAADVEDAAVDGDVDGAGDILDVGEDSGVPDPPQHLGTAVTVEQEPDEAIHANGWFHLLWTGEYFSFLYERACPDVSVGQCLAMRRFGKDGIKIGPDWLYTPASTDPDVITMDMIFFDICWSRDLQMYGLAWVESEHYGAVEDIVYSAYFQRLNRDGKVFGEPVLLRRDMIQNVFSTAQDAPIRLGCSSGGWLAGYPIDVAWGDHWTTRYLYLHLLDASALTAGGAFYGEDHTEPYLWQEGLRFLDGEFILAHEVEPVNVLLERVPESFEITWRNALMSGYRNLVFDWDTEEATGRIAVTMNTAFHTYFVVIDSSGEIIASTEILEGFPNVVSRIASIGNGRYAVLWQRCSCDGPDQIKVKIVTDGGLESGHVVVTPAPDFSWVWPHEMQMDLVWTGDEIAVVALLSDVAGTGMQQPYMQLLVP